MVNLSIGAAVGLAEDFWGSAVDDDSTDVGDGSGEAKDAEGLGVSLGARDCALELDVAAPPAQAERASVSVTTPSAPNESRIMIPPNRRRIEAIRWGSFRTLTEWLDARLIWPAETC